MAGPKHGIIGDDSFGTELPETTVPENQLNEEKKAARFSKTKEYKVLKEYIEERIKYYQKYLPDGREIGSVDRAQLGDKWEVANTIVREFQLILDSYENAAEAVKGK